MKHSLCGPATSRQQEKGRPGFTLVELLTATAILTLLSLFLVAAADQAARLWKQGDAQVQYRERARAALDYIGRDMHQALLSPQGANGPLQFLIDPPSVSSPSSNCRDTVFWQAPVATDTSKGDLAEVGYFVNWNGTTGNLCRFFVNPSDTSNYLIYTSSPWISDAGNPSILSTVAPANQAHNYQGLFLENVIGLWVNGYQVDGTPYGTASGNSYIGNSVTAGDLPAFVQISLVLLDSATAARLNTSTVSTIQGLYASSATPQAFVASLPVAIRPGASVATLRVSLENYK